MCDCLFVGIVGLSRGDRDTGSPEVAGLEMDTVNRRVSIQSKAAVSSELESSDAVVTAVGMTTTFHYAQFCC